MLKHIRRIIMSGALMSALIGLALLANFTAPNPTGRRYSSEMPSRELSDMQRGFDAERILSKDLGIENNNSSDAGQCICNQTRYAPDKSPRQYNCNVCVVYSPLVESYNIPDFITDRYIVESKDALKMDARSQEQLPNFALMAIQLKRPLWLFVSHRTAIPPHITQLVEQTGGKVVPYFSYPGFVDPVDEDAITLLFGGFVFLSLGLAWEYAVIKGRNANAPSYNVPEPTTPKPGTPHPKRPSDNPLRDAESFVTRTVEKRRIQIDIEDSRNDLK